MWYLNSLSLGENQIKQSVNCAQYIQTLCIKNISMISLYLYPSPSAYIRG